MARAEENQQRRLLRPTSPFSQKVHSAVYCSDVTGCVSASGPSEAIGDADKDDRPTAETKSPSLKLPCRVQTTSASLKEIIASFRRAQEAAPSPTPCPPALPPLSEEMTPEPIQPRAMQMHNEWQQEQRDSLVQDTSPATKVYVMPSGYIVQSVQMVLEKKQSEKGDERVPSLSPFFRPEPYRCRSSGCYLPLREAPVEVSCCFMETDVRLEMIKTAPRKEAFPAGCVPGGIDVRNFLNGMEENEKRLRFLPIPLQQHSPHPLNRDTQELLAQLNRNVIYHEPLLSGETDVTSEETQLSKTSLDLEERLQDFSRRLEQFCEA